MPTKYLIKIYIESDEADPSALLDAALETEDHFNTYADGCVLDDDNTSVEEVN